MRRHALAALDRAIQEGKEGGADIEAARVDPVLRPFVKRRVRRAMQRAVEATTVVAGDEGVLHTMRLAYLDVAGRAQPADAVDDVARVRAAFDEVRTKRAPAGFWWATTLLLTALAAAGAGGYWLWQRPSRHQAVHDSPAGVAFVQKLPPVLHALEICARAHAMGTVNKELSAAALAARDDLFAPAVRAQLGASAGPLNAALASAVDLATVPLTGDPQPALRQLHGALRDFDTAGFAGKSDYLMVGEIVTYEDWRQLLLFSYGIEQRFEDRVDGQVVPVAHVGRLDNAGTRLWHLGEDDEDAPGPIVVLDDVERFLVKNVLPIIPEQRGPTRPTGSPVEDSAGWEEVVGAILRDDLATLPDVDAEDFAALLTLVARRRTLVKGWRGRVDGLEPPDRFAPETSYDRYREIVDKGELAEVAKIQDRLASWDMTRASRRLVDAFSVATERFLLQEHLDRTSKALPTAPPVLASARGDEELAASDSFAKTNREISGLLAEIASSPALGRVLVALELYAVDGGEHRFYITSAYSSVLAELAEELGFKARLGDGGAMARELRDKPKAEIAAAAKKVWERWYKKPLAPVERRARD